MTEDEYVRAVKRSGRRVYLLAFSYTRNRYDAEDIMQNTFMKLWKSDEPFESDAHLDRWLTRVCVNECKDFFRLSF
ncbi:MAG: RNA polymerase sigma factor, partial [Clostridia bacterium]|nr:RNA polymerase sigma factor [Clostridia bacterium]